MTLKAEAKSHGREVKRIGAMAVGLCQGYSIGRDYEGPDRQEAVLWYTLVMDAVRRHPKIVKIDPERSIRLFEAIKDAVRSIDDARNSNRPLALTFGVEQKRRLKELSRAS